jgi:O-antigen ligase
MHGHYSLGRLIGFAITLAIVFVGYLVIEVADRLTASPAMRRRVNEGSDSFFRERGSVWQAAWQATRDLFSQFGGRRFSDPDPPPNED